MNLDGLIYIAELLHQCIGALQAYGKIITPEEYSQRFRALGTLSGVPVTEEMVRTATANNATVLANLIDISMTIDAALSAGRARYSGRPS